MTMKKRINKRETLPQNQPRDEEILKLQSQVSYLTEIINLRDDGYYRQRQLAVLEGIRQALEESLIEESEETDE